MTMAVTIVPIEHQYLEQLQAAVDSVSRERRFLGTVEGFSLEQHRHFAESITQGGGVQLIALSRDAVVGWCDIRRNPFEGFQHVGALGVGLLPEWREQGLGRRLIKVTIEAARAKGVTRVELETFASNPRAIHVFELLGFSTEGIKRRARVLDDQEDDLVCMALLLN